MDVLSFRFFVLVGVFIGQSTLNAAYRSDYRGLQRECTRARPTTCGSNWKQCVWRNTNEESDNGQVHECLFYKEQAHTFLRVVYQGTLRVACSKHCCKRWFFTFNQRECSSPAPIDALVYQDVGGAAGNIHRSASQEGYCGGIGRGIVKVGFSVGNCHGYGDTNAYTSWNSVSRIVIEEVNPPQV